MREKNNEKERRREIKREIERKREKKRETERKDTEKMSRVNYYQSAFNSQKEELNILAEMLEISKTGCGCIYNRPLSLKELLSELIKYKYKRQSRAIC